MLRVSLASLMADTNIITEKAPLHPLQRNYIPGGPRGAYEIKKVEGGIYARIDMPGLKPNDLRVVKMSGINEVKIQGISKDHKRFSEMDSSLRIYFATIKVICTNFDQVTVQHSIINGVCRVFLNAADQGFLITYRTAQPEPEPARNINPTWQLHPDSGVRIGGLDKFERHESNCQCCKGKGRPIPNGPLSEEMGKINPFIVRGVRGVFECKFDPVGDGSGDSYMYFRLDMPDCYPCSLMMDKQEKRIAIIGFEAPPGTDFKWDEPGGRRYFCEITFNCNCCCFGVNDKNNRHFLEDGVYRLVVRVLGNSLTRELPTTSSSDRVTSEPPTILEQPCSTSTTNHSRRRRSNLRR